MSGESINYIEKLKNISKDDDNNKIICNCENSFINFDKLKNKKKYKNPPSSPDMLFISISKKEIWFIEFKSSSKINLENKKHKIKRKILDGLIVFYEIYRNYFDFKKYYFVVYNKYSSYEDEVIEELSENRTIEFELEELKGKFLEDVFTENCEEFKNIFSQKFNIEFECEK